MTDGVNVDWGLLRQPDYVGDYANAFQVGRQMAGPPPVVPPSVNAFATGTPTGQTGPQPDDVASRIANLDPAARGWASQQAELIGSLGAGLSAFPYVQRPGILAHLAPALIARGLPPEALASFDPTDAALDDAMSAARSLGARLNGPPSGGG